MGRSGSGGTIVPGEKENVDLARSMAPGWREMAPAEGYIEGKSHLGLLIDWKRGMWERKGARVTLVIH